MSCWEKRRISFSRLLLAGANSKKYIEGEGKDKVRISARLFAPGRDAYEGEVILCFQLDDRDAEKKRIVSLSLDMPTYCQRCDGLVFYSQDDKEENVICLVEMKGRNITEAANQLISTKRLLEKLFNEECHSLPESSRKLCKKQITHIQWKACIYHNSPSPEKLKNSQKALKDSGFIDIAFLSSADNDLRPLLSGEERSAREMEKKYKSKRK